MNAIGLPHPPEPPRPMAVQNRPRRLCHGLSCV